MASPIILGVPLDEYFFRNSIIKHLSFPIHEPWLFSPYISVTMNPECNTTVNPRSLYYFNIRHAILAIELGREDAQMNRYIYRLPELIAALALPASIYDHRAAWEDEYLVLHCIPREVISSYTREQFRQMRAEQFRQVFVAARGQVSSNMLT